MTGEEMMRILDGVSPLVIRRERAGMSLKTLAVAADVSASYLAEIETGKKPGSVVAMAKLAKVLGVSIETLLA